MLREFHEVKLTSDETIATLWALQVMINKFSKLEGEGAKRELETLEVVFHKLRTQAETYEETQTSEEEERAAILEDYRRRGGLAETQ